ncbi:MAG: DUF4861 domain-containing protein [Bacteroidales bacterium]|nr:DUF4861 domain-containing protein [Bacteroidales bacterium]
MLSAMAQTDAYLKLYDHHGKHPRIESITYPGVANTIDMYNSLYGHGAVIENPWVAYRVYMDNRQSLDLYVKQTPRLELEETGFYTTPQQMDAGYGCDVLWAGKSVGAGSFRGWQMGNPVTIDTVASRTQSIIDSCTVEVIDRDWIYNGHPIQMTQRYRVSPERRDLWVEISLKGNLPSDIFCTGIQKLELDNRGFVRQAGVAASWGSNVPDKTLPDLVEVVGLGVVVNPENVASVAEDDLNYLIFLQPDPHGIIRYRVISCGARERDGFTNSEEWFEYISNLK